MKPATQRSQQAERVKAEILEAAIPLFARGFDSVAIKEIAEASGYKHSLVMYHFATKDQLWEQAAARLMQRFDELHRQRFEQPPQPTTDREKMIRLLQAFIAALRDLPAYGQILLSEGAHPSGRLLWLHQHYFPSAFRDIRFDDEAVRELLMKMTLVRTAVGGALLYTVVAGPQIALSAELDGGELPSEIHPMSDAVAKRLAEMMAEFVFSQLPAAAPPKRARARRSRKRESAPAALAGARFFEETGCGYFPPGSHHFFDGPGEIPIGFQRCDPAVGVDAIHRHQIHIDLAAVGQHIAQRGHVGALVAARIGFAHAEIDLARRDHHIPERPDRFLAAMAVAGGVEHRHAHRILHDGIVGEQRQPALAIPGAHVFDGIETGLLRGVRRLEKLQHEIHLQNVFSLGNARKSPEYYAWPRLGAARPCAARSLEHSVVRGHSRRAPASGFRICPDISTRRDG
jgi:AcrR family transcriptional regulator